MTEAKTIILQAASELFLEGGFAALSVRSIAQRADVSTMGIYHHFGGKQGILDALYIEGFGLISESVVDTAGGNGQALLLEGCRQYLQVAEQYQAHYRLIFGEHGGDYVPSTAAQESARAAFRKIRDAVAHVLAPPATSQQKTEAAMQLWAQLHGFVSLKQQTLTYNLKASQWQRMVLRAAERLIAELSERK